MSFDLDLATRRALVTGGTKGVGAAVVEVLRDAGAQVMTTARSIPARRTEGVHYVAADLSTAEGASAVAQSVLQQLGGIDILVNVLGGSSAPGGGFAVLDDAQWSKELNRRGFGNSCLRESAERSLAQAKPVRAATQFRRCPRARRSPAGIA